MLKDTKTLTEFVFNQLESKFTQLHWQLYQDVDNLKGETLPIASLELQSFDTSKRLSIDKHSVTANFSIRLLFNANELAQLNIRDAALAISTYLNNHQITDRQIESIEIISNQQDYLTPEVSGYVNWEIQFNVIFHYGNSIYADNGISPEITSLININVT